MKFMINRRTFLQLPVILLAFFSLMAYGQDQDFVVRGKVYSAATGMPMSDIGINSVNSPKEPVSTDSLGFFQITLENAKDQLLFSYPGFKEKQVFVHGKEFIEIWLLDEDYISVSDPVEMVFRKGSPKDFSGAVELSRNIEMYQLAGASFDQELQGNLSGLNVTSRSGMPGEGATMTSRGYASLFSSSLPAVIVDGMFQRSEGFSSSIIHGFHSNPLADIDKRDISSIVLLKDAAESGSFGLRASNGVLLVTTVPPRGGQTTMDVSVSGGIASAPEQIPVMDASHYSSYVMEQMYGAGLSSSEIFSQYPFLENNPGYLYYSRYDNNTDWQDEVFSNGNLFDAHLTVRGGDARARYSLSGGYLSNQAIIQNASYKRFNFRFNSVVQVSSKLDIGFNLSYTNGQSDLMETGAVPQTNPMFASMIKSPRLGVFQKDQEGISLPVFDDVADFGLSNPAVIVNEVEASDATSKFLGVSYLNIKITDHLSVRAQFGIDRLKSNEKIFIPSWGMATQGDGSAERSMKVKVNQYYAVMGEARVSYQKRFSFIHDFSADAGGRYMVHTLLQDAGAAQNSATDEFRDLNSGKADEKSVAGFEDQWSWLNYFISTKYIFDDRYILKANLSLDASSKFGSQVEDGISMGGQAFAVLPSMGVAWRISSESFMPDFRFLDELKIRASYGWTGSDDFMNNYTHLYYKTIPYYSITGFTLYGLYNPELKWELVKKGNIGLDLVLFNERLILNTNWYKEITEDMITYRELPVYYGFESYILNGGSCQNKGMEYSIYWRVIDRDFKWEIDANFFTYRNEILSLESDQIINGFRGGEKISMVGQAMGLFYGYEYLGVFGSQDEAELANLVDKAGRSFNAGDAHFNDRDENGVIDELDKTIIGDPHPSFATGIYNRLSYKGFSLGFMITYSGGMDVFNYIRSQMESMSGYDNQSTAIYNRWQTEGQQTAIPKASYGDPMGNNRFSSRWIEDGSYVRLKNITLSYTFKTNISFINNLNIFLTGSNLITYTNYLGYDPEFSYMDGTLGQGIDYGKIPQPKSIIIGLKMGL